VWAVLTVTSLSLNGIFNANLNLYAVLIIFAAVLFSERAVIVTTSLSILGTIILAFSQGQGILPLHTTPLYLADRFFSVDHTLRVGGCAVDSSIPGDARNAGAHPRG
jgi:hypothetical protein